MGKSSVNGPFSMAMLSNQRVNVSRIYRKYRIACLNMG
jgi:hypothetical protein